MRRLVILVSLVLACHEDSAADPPFEPACGAEGPVALLNLEPGQEVLWAWRIDESGDLMVNASDPRDDDAEVRSVIVDRCGETRADLTMAYTTLSRWSGGLLGCHHDALVWLTGYDDPSPTTLAHGCSLEATGTLRLTYDIEPEQSTGRLLALEAVGPHVETRVLVEGTTGPWPVLVGDHVLVPTSEGQVLRVDPHTGEEAVELQSVVMWTADEHTIAYRPAGDSAEAGPIVLRDQQTGAEQTIDAALPDSWRLEWWAEGVLVAKPPDPLASPRWFGHSPVRELVPPAGANIVTVRSDGLVWLSRHDAQTEQTELLRWREPEPPQPAWSCRRCVLRSVRAEGMLDVLVPNSEPNAWALWRVDDAGGPARELAASVSTDYLVLDDERVLTVVPRVGGKTGPLYLYDGSRSTLADSVHSGSINWTNLYRRDDEEVLYVTHDGTPTLWRAVF